MSKGGGGRIPPPPPPGLLGLINFTCQSCSWWGWLQIPTCVVMKWPQSSQSKAMVATVSDNFWRASFWSRNGGGGVNNRLTGWHLPTQWIDFPKNSSCQLPKIAYPVNYLAHWKMGTTMINNQQFKPKFWQNWIKAKEKPQRHSQNRQKLCVVLKYFTLWVRWKISTHLKTPVHENLHCVSRWWH